MRRDACPAAIWVFVWASCAMTGPLYAAEADAEAIWRQLSPHFRSPAPADEFGKYGSPLKFDDGRPITEPAQWPQRRAEILSSWHAMLGPWPPLLTNPKVEYLDEESRDGFRQHHVKIEIASGGKQTDGYLLIPHGAGPFPAVLVTFYDAKTSVGLGEKGQGLYDFGYQLARRGFVTLSIGTPGGRVDGKDTREALVRAGHEQGIQPLSFLAYVAANCHTVLAKLPQVDRERIGVVGLSYGGKWAMFASCLHEKFACGVWSDPGIVFDESNRNINYYEPWYLGFDPQTMRSAGVPSEKNPRTGLYKKLIDEGRDLDELHLLMAPRPFLVSGGSEDGPQRWPVLNRSIAVNKLLGYENRVAMTNRPGHIPTPEAAEQTCLFFEYFLQHKKP